MATARKHGPRARLQKLPPRARPLCIAEVEDLWDSALPVFDDPRTARWLRACADNPARGWGGSAAWFGDPAELVALAGVARALPPGHPHPPWATVGGRAWSTAGWSMVLPCYGLEGDLRALRALWTGTESGDHTRAPWRETVPPFADEELAPKGAGATRGTVYACPVGRAVLEAGSELMHRGAWDGRVLVVEGGATFLRYAIDPKRHAVHPNEGLGPTFPRPAVLGVWPGCWPDDQLGEAFADRLNSARVVILTSTSKPLIRSVSATCERVGVRVLTHG
jgi:hypothetical protein